MSSAIDDRDTLNKLIHTLMTPYTRERDESDETYDTRERVRRYQATDGLLSHCSGKGIVISNMRFIDLTEPLADKFIAAKAENIKLQKEAKNRAFDTQAWQNQCEVLKDANQELHADINILTGKVAELTQFRALHAKSEIRIAELEQEIAGLTPPPKIYKMTEARWTLLSDIETGTEMPEGFKCRGLADCIKAGWVTVGPEGFYILTESGQVEVDAPCPDAPPPSAAKRAKAAEARASTLEQELNAAFATEDSVLEQLQAGAPTPVVINIIKNHRRGSRFNYSPATSASHAHH